MKSLKQKTMNKNYPRLFIGLDLAAKDKLAIAEWRDKYLRGLPDKPVPAENLHITLSFLGQVKPDKLEQLDQLLQHVEGRQFHLSTTALGTFSKPQILYLGVELPQELQTLAQQCLSINSQLGLPSHHGAYRPHITLTRKHKDMWPIIAEPPKIQMSFSQFHLFESVSSSEIGVSPHYPKRFSFDLAPNLKQTKSI